MTTNTQYKLLYLLGQLVKKIRQRRKIQFVLLILLTLISSFAEIISLGAVIPFIGILTQPETVFSDPRLSWMIQTLEIASPVDMIFPLTIAFASAAFAAGVIRLILLWSSLKLGNFTGAELGTEIFKRTLFQPYDIHIARNSSEIISAITQKVATVTAVLISLVSVLTSSILGIAILLTIIVIEPLVAFVALVSFGAGYGLIAAITRQRLIKNGEEIAREQSNVVKSLQEGLGAIRDVLLDRTQAAYTSIYENSILKLQKAATENSFFNQAPRFAMESLGIILIALFALMLSNRPGGVGGALPVLGMLALGAQRLLPLMQQIYGNWSVLNGSKAALVDVLDLLEQEVLEPGAEQIRDPIVFEDEINFNNVGFCYSSTSPFVLREINLKVRKGERIGLIGPTGCGKSTLMDLLMALLSPSEGEIKIDGRKLTSDNSVSWQNTLAHVPQNIFLTDSSIAENIAFGISRHEIDMDRVRYCAEQARLDDYIQDISTGYDTLVGERGVRLSGGQKQRIGIARALYKQVSVLVLDEATSALDNDTEAAVMSAIENLSKELTIFIIAHRISTLANCDRIIQLKDGRITCENSYTELCENLSRA